MNAMNTTVCNRNYKDICNKTITIVIARVLLTTGIFLPPHAHVCYLLHTYIYFTIPVSCRVYTLSVYADFPVSLPQMLST